MSMNDAKMSSGTSPNDAQTEQLPFYRLLDPEATQYAPHSPLIICIHGSGTETCSPSWDNLVTELSRSYRVLLWNRANNTTPAAATDNLRRHLKATQLSGPYVLIAHSYGGTFARYFLHHHPTDVAGMVLAETGQKTALEPRMEREQYRQQILGDSPLSVIRANSLIGKWKELEAAEASTRDGDEESRASAWSQLSSQRAFLEQFDAEDERFKKVQLGLSRNCRYVYVADCGHHVVRDRPDIMAAEVRWVMERVDLDQHQHQHRGADYRIKGFRRIAEAIRSRFKGLRG